MEGIGSVANVLRTFVDNYGVRVANTGLFYDDILSILVSVISVVVTVLLSVYAHKPYKNDKERAQVQLSVWSLKIIQVFILLCVGIFNAYLYVVGKKDYGVIHRWKVGIVSVLSAFSLLFTTTMDITSKKK